jgi:hypothetical protein
MPQSHGIKAPSLYPNTDFHHSFNDHLWWGTQDQMKEEWTLWITHLRDAGHISGMLLRNGDWSTIRTEFLSKGLNFTKLLDVDKFLKHRRTNLEIDLHFDTPTSMVLLSPKPVQRRGQMELF